MAPMAMGLSDEDIADSAAYTASLPAQESVGVDEKFVALGEEIYTRGAEGVMACTACTDQQERVSKRQASLT